MHYLLFYEKANDYAEKQKPLVAAHHAYLDGLVASRHLILGGSMEDPVDGSAILLFKADSLAAVEGFAKNDPYVLHGVVCQWHGIRSSGPTYLIRELGVTEKQNGPRLIEVGSRSHTLIVDCLRRLPNFKTHWGPIVGQNIFIFPM